MRTMFFAAATAALGLGGCTTTGGGGLGAPVSPAALNANPPPHWVGHRVYNEKYQTWGYLKRPEETWSKSFPVILYEHQALAPDRTLESRGADNNFQYKLYGRFWDKKGYEPVLNRLLPVFVLERFEPIGEAGELGTAGSSVREGESTAAPRQAGLPLSRQRRLRSGRSYEQIDY